MGVYTRKGGKIWYIRFKDPSGKIVRESTEQESKKTAQGILRKRRTEIAEGKYLDRQERPEMTFKELAEWFWEHHGQYKKANGYKAILDRFTKYFGSRPIQTITPELINEFRQGRLEDVSERTVNRDVQILKCMFNRIIEFKRWGKVIDNPVRYIKLTKERNERIRYLEPKQIEALLNKASDRLKPILVTALHTGMRRGEILSLRWEHVNLKTGTLYVAESKSGEGRHIPISSKLKGTFQELPSRFRKGYVFPSYLPSRRAGAETDSQRPYTDLKTGFSKALTAAKISDFRFHDLRHTFASQLVMNGADLNTVRELLGHKSLKMTLRYAHLSPGHKQEAIRLIDRAMSTCRKKPGDTASDTVRNRRKAKAS